MRDPEDIGLVRVRLVILGDKKKYIKKKKPARGAQNSGLKICCALRARRAVAQVISQTAAAPPPAWHGEIARDVVNMHTGPGARRLGHGSSGGWLVSGAES